ARVRRASQPHSPLLHQAGVGLMQNSLVSLLLLNARYIAPAIMFVVIVLAWEYSPALFSIPEFVLPRLSRVINTLIDTRSIPLFFDTGIVTLAEALIGLLIGG